MKVLITNPPWIFGNRFGIRAGSRWSYSDPNFDPCYTPYPGFMGYATTYLLSQGVEAVFYDAIACRDNYPTFFKKVDEFSPDIIIQETSTPSFNIDLKIAEELHKKYEVCLAGPHPSAFAERVIELPFVDYILKGEYEYSSLEMVRTRRKGIYESVRVKNLDDLPYPYRDKNIIHQYKEYNCRKGLAFPQLWIYGGRGCAYHCNFCVWVHTMFNNKITLRKPEKILNEVEDMVTRYGFKYIEFDDDCWNLGGDSRLFELADGLKRIGVPWSILGRMDTCSKDTFKYLVDSGCVGLRLGVESLVPRLLEKTNKKLRVETLMDTINYLKSLNVSLYLCFMHYLPGETEEDRDEQNRAIRALGIPCQNPPCIPFPGTPYYQSFIDAGFDPEKSTDWGEYDGGIIGGNLRKLVSGYLQKISDNGEDESARYNKKVLVVLSK